MPKDRLYSTVKLFHDGKLYKELLHGGSRRAIKKFMDDQFKQIPVNNRYQYFFEVESIGGRKFGNPVILIEENGLENRFDNVKKAHELTGISIKIIYLLLKNKNMSRQFNSKKIEFRWAD